MDKIAKLRCVKGLPCSVVILCACRSCRKYAASVELAFEESAIEHLPESIRRLWRFRRLTRVGR